MSRTEKHLYRSHVVGLRRLHAVALGGGVCAGSLAVAAIGALFSDTFLMNMSIAAALVGALVLVVGLLSWKVFGRPHSIAAKSKPLIASMHSAYDQNEMRNRVKNNNRAWILYAIGIFAGIGLCAIGASNLSLPEGHIASVIMLIFGILIALGSGIALFRAVQNR